MRSADEFALLASNERLGLRSVKKSRNNASDNDPNNDDVFTFQADDDVQIDVVRKQLKL